MDEEWKWIKGFKGQYQISNYGRVKSFKKTEGGYILSNQKCNRRLSSHCFKKFCN